jgi:hypothetical protein
MDWYSEKGRCRILRLDHSSMPNSGTYAHNTTLLVFGLVKVTGPVFIPSCDSAES